MLRVALALLLVGHLAAAGSLVTSVASDPCEERCPDDDPAGRCAPTCVDCVCCPHVSPVAIPEVITSSPVEVAEAVPEISVTRPAAPEPNDILHVPRAS